MYVIAKRIVLGLSIWVGIILLMACSSKPSDPQTSSVEIRPTSPYQEDLLVSPSEDPAITRKEPTKIPISTPTKIKETAIEEKMVPPIDGPAEEMPASLFADVISVQISGAENSNQFSVEIRSPDTGCEQYADWWEIITVDGELIYRRILTHSHVNEQPFVRSGGPVVISTDAIVIVRAHMYPDGYGGAAYWGSVESGFEEILLEKDFAADLERIDPLPDGCAF